ncbi:TlpA family protein disulfide reductase [Flavitalea flava]
MGPILLHAQTAALPKTITVKGSLQFIDPKGDKKVRLFKEMMSGKPKLIDSVTVSEDKKSFRFVLKQDHPGIYHVEALQGWDRASFWSDADVNMEMRGYDTSLYKVKIPHYNFVDGSMDNNFINLFEHIEQLSYLRMIDEYNEEYYAQEYKAKDSTWITHLKITPRYDSMTRDLHERTDLLFKVYKDRPVVLYGLRSMTGAESTGKYDYALQSLDRLIGKYPWLTEAKEAKQTIITNRELARKVKPGKPIPSISYPDGNGKMQGLKKYKGKYLLIDFWASWCGPCRQAIPKVKELYGKQHPDGFEIVSISIDADKNAWRKAVGEEKMPWEQLLSPNMDETMKQFQFSGVPTFYIVDPNGKIIRTFTGYGPDSEADIEAILKNKTMAPSEESIAMPAMGF